MPPFTVASLAVPPDETYCTAQASLIAWSLCPPLPTIRFAAAGADGRSGVRGTRRHRLGAAAVDGGADRQAAGPEIVRAAEFDRGAHGRSVDVLHAAVRDRGAARGPAGQHIQRPVVEHREAAAGLAGANVGNLARGDGGAGNRLAQDDDGSPGAAVGEDELLAGEILRRIELKVVGEAVLDDL